MSCQCAILSESIGINGFNIARRVVAELLKVFALLTEPCLGLIFHGARWLSCGCQGEYFEFFLVFGKEWVTEGIVMVGVCCCDF